MSAPFSGLRILFIAPVDDAGLVHNRLRRRALERLGAQVSHVDPTQGRLLDLFKRRDLSARLHDAIKQHHPEVVLVAGEQLLEPSLVEELQKASRTARWVQLLGEGLPDYGAAVTEAKVYHNVYVGSTGAVAAFDSQGIKHARYLAVGCDPSVHKPLKARGPYRANVVFAGEATRRREELLQEVVEFGLAVWGPGWRRTALRDYCRGEVPSTEDFVRAYAGASVAVNIHRDIGGDLAGLNRRTFEIAAIGAAQVVDSRTDLPRHFADGTEVLVYQNPKELHGHVGRMLQDEKQREAVAAAGRQRAISNHTYMHRMHELLRAVTAALPRAAERK